jgi:polar amino acid transport system substrate-binding protein
VRRASINLGNPVLAQTTPDAPSGVTVDPAREAEVAFTAPYVVIEGVYAVPDASPVTTAADALRRSGQEAAAVAPPA